MGTGTSTGGRRRHGLGGHIVFQMRGWMGYAANFSVYQYHRLKSPSSPESNLSELYQRGWTLTNHNFHAVPLREGLLQYLKLLIFDRLDSCHRFKVAFNLCIMPAENRIVPAAHRQKRCLFMDYVLVLVATTSLTQIGAGNFPTPPWVSSKLVMLVLRWSTLVI